MNSKIQQKGRLKAVNRALTLVVLLMIAFLVGVSVGLDKDADNPNIVSIYKPCTKKQIVIHDEQRSGIRLPAVNRNGTGVAANLAVSVLQGSGLVLVNLNRVISKEETLNSIRMAALVASDITGIDTGNLDIIYDIYANASLLEGPSAGAAMTIATIAALEGRQVNNDVLITGIINHDGTIGPAGKVKEKALSAKENGAKAFYVPVGSSTEINYTEEEFCHTWGTYEYCQPELKTEIIDLSEETGIEIIEAENLRDILDAFIGEKDPSM